jgi:hypothetical protein
MWFLITLISSVFLVLSLGLLAVFPLRISIRRQEHMRRSHLPARRIRKDDELYLDDEEL